MSINVEEKLVEILVDIADENNFTLETNLFEEGLLDSMSMVRLLIEIEEVFGVYIAVTEIERDNFNSVSSIAKFIKEKMQNE